MMELFTAIGLMFLMEGIMYAAFPRGMRDMVMKISELNDSQLRYLGLGFAVFGLLIIAVLRGF